MGKRFSHHSNESQKERASGLSANIPGRPAIHLAMRYKLTKILVLVVCWLCCVPVLGQSYIVDPTSIHLEETASNWRSTILTGFALSGTYGFAFYRVEIPPIEVGVPKFIGPDSDRHWLMDREVKKAIAWAADQAAYLCAQKWIANRSYYTLPSRVQRDFKQLLRINLQTKIPAERVKSEDFASPRIGRSKIAFMQISYPAYLLHLGIGR